MYYIQCIRNELAICLNLLCFSLVSHVRTLHMGINGTTSQISPDSICPSIHTSTPWLKSWLFISCTTEIEGFPGGAVVKNPPTNTGETTDSNFIPGLGRSPRGENGNLLQYSCLGHSVDRGTWWAIVHRVAKSWTWLSTHIHKWNWFPWLVFLTLVLVAKCNQKWLC